MDQEVQLVTDGVGLAIIGEPAAVDAFLISEGLISQQLDLSRLAPALGNGATVARAGAQIAENSGRWVQLTKESAHLASKYGLRQSSSSGLSTGVVKGASGQIRGFVEFAKGPGAMLTNPAILAGAAGIMAQLAMQQAMDEITDYLAAIDAKVDSILRAQKDAVLSEMIGTQLLINETMNIREQVGRVSEVAWSKVQSTPATIASTQAYALRQLDAVAESIEKASSAADRAKAAAVAQERVQEWLAVLAQCVRLQDALGLLELDRVLDADPEELDRHRVALNITRENRLMLIVRTTEQLLDRVDKAAATTTTRVLLHPIASRKAIDSTNSVGSIVIGFQHALGIEYEREALEARRWSDAVAEVTDKAVQSGNAGVNAAKSLGADGVGHVRSISGRVSHEIASRRRGRGGDADER